MCKNCRSIFGGLLRKITNSNFDTCLVVCELHCDHVKKDKSKQKGNRVCPFSTHGNSIAVQGNIRAWTFRVWRKESKTIYLYIFVAWSLLTKSILFIFVFLTRRRLAKSPERVPLPPPFASYSTVSRAAPSRANSYRSVPSRPREEPTVDSTITASVTSPPAVETRVPESQV